MTFDLERIKADLGEIGDPRFCDCEVRTQLAEAIAEIERLRVALLKSDNSNKIRRGITEGQDGLIVELDDKIRRQDTRIKGLGGEIERLRGYEIAARDLSADLTKVAGDRDEHAARIKELESSLDEAEALTKKNADLMNIYLARIAELEDALVEGLTNFLHYRASCYDPARRCPYAKECDDCSTWDACGHVEKFRSEARQRLQADGKIGPDARPRSWQITEERMRAIRLSEELAWDCKVVDVLRAMLQEAGL